MYVSAFKVAYTSGPFYEKKYEAVPHIFLYKYISIRLIKGINKTYY